MSIIRFEFCSTLKQLSTVAFSFKMASLELDFDDDGGVHRLEGSSGEEQGGLVIMKKKPDGETPHTFKKPDMPKVSLFGLDKLAALKRETENLEGGGTPKRSKVLSYKDDDDDDVEEERSSDDTSKGGSNER